MVEFNLLSTLLMGFIVATVFVAVAKIGAKREPPNAQPGERNTIDTLAARTNALLRNPTAWTVGFVVVALGVSFAAIAAVGDLGLPERIVGPLLGVVGAVIGILLAGFVFIGTYSSIRARGVGNAQGIAAGSLAVGLLFLFVIVLQLIVGLV